MHLTPLGIGCVLGDVLGHIPLLGDLPLRSNVDSTNPFTLAAISLATFQREMVDRTSASLAARWIY